MQVAFLCGALLLLTGILFSGTFRAWLKVFISKHFYSYDYDYREEWLRFTRTLSRGSPALGERTIAGGRRAGRKPGRRAVAAPRRRWRSLSSRWRAGTADQHRDRAGRFEFLSLPGNHASG